MTTQEATPRPTTMTLRLKEPIELDGQAFTEFEMKELTAGQFEEGVNGAAAGVTRNLKLISLSAKVPLAAVRRMATSDMVKAKEFLEGFLEGQPTGATS